MPKVFNIIYYKYTSVQPIDANLGKRQDGSIREFISYTTLIKCMIYNILNILSKILKIHCTSI